MLMHTTLHISFEFASQLAKEEVTQDDFDRVSKFLKREKIFSQLQSMATFLIPHETSIYLVLNLDGKSYTDGKKIVVGLPLYMMKRSYEEIFAAICALLGHESQHVNSSNFQAYGDYRVRFDSYFLKKYPHISVQAMTKFSKIVTKYFGNGVEDGRIERILCSKLEGFLKYIRFFRVMWWKNQPVTGQSELNDFLFAIVTYATMGLLPKSFKKYYAGTEAMNQIQQLQPMILEGIRAMNARRCLELCEEMIYHAEPYLIGLLEDMTDEERQEMKNTDTSDEYTTSNERDFNRDDAETVTHFKKEKKKDKPEGKKEEDKEEDKEKSRKKSPESEENEDQAEEENDDSSKNSDQGDGEESDSKEKKEEAEADDQPDTAASDSSEKVKDEEGEEEENSANRDDDSESDKEDGGSTGDEAEDSADEEGDNASDADGDEDGSDVDPKDTDDESDSNADDSDAPPQSSPDQSEDVNDPRNDGEDEAKAEALDESIVEEAFAKIEAELEADGIKEKVAADEPVTMNPNKPEKDDPATQLTDEERKAIELKYASQLCNTFEERRGFPLTRDLPGTFRIEGSRFRKEVERILKNKQPLTYRGQKRGILDAGNLWRLGTRETNVFVKRSVPALTDYVAYLLKDGSGSMSQDKKEYHASFAVSVAEEGLKGIIPFKIAEFSTNNSNKVIHHVIKDFKENSARSYTYNHSFYRKAKDGNKDGFSIRIATAELVKRPEKDRILIVFSDGLPSDYPSDDVAKEDVKKAVKEARAKGIFVVSILFGTELYRMYNMESYRYMYGNSVIACDPTEITSKLVALLKKLIIR